MTPHDKEWCELKEFVDDLFADTYIFGGVIYDTNTKQPSTKFKGDSS